MPDGVFFGNYRLHVGARTLDGRSDVFFAGICVYELLTDTPLNPDLPPQKRTVVVRPGEETRLSLELK